MYLAPEVPALSSTFVYNEILQLRQNGVEVEVSSVHRPSAIASEQVLERIGQDIFYLYENSFAYSLLLFFRFFVTEPGRVYTSIRYLITDILRVGCFCRLSLGLAYRYLYSFYLARKLQQKNISHLHIHFAHVPSDIGMYAALLTGTPFSITAHANDIYERGWLLQEKVERSRFVVTISEYNKTYLISIGCDQEKIQVIRCGVDLERFSLWKSSDNRESLRIGSLGRMVPKKGFADLIRALAIVKGKGVGFNAEIAGDGPLREDLEKLVIKKGLQQNVTFLGPLKHEDVAEWLAGLDIFVLACCHDINGDVDGIPVVLMEAMASGVVVISTSVTGVAELVINNESGLLCEPNDYRGIGNAILTLQEDSVFSSTLAKGARERVEKYFALADNVCKLHQQIQDSN